MHVFPITQEPNLLIHFRPIYKFIEVGRWLHFSSIISILFGRYLYLTSIEVYMLNDGRPDNFLKILSVCFFIIPVFAELDARSRFQDYKLIKDLIFENGINPRIIKLFQFSKCQRDALYFAARDLGYKNEIKNHFKVFGYRWYHFFPDFVWKNPSYLFSKHFWSVTFLTPTYVSKYF